METNEGSDDPSSGWMQVKKKHKSNLKLPLHGWVEGSSTKQSSCKPKGHISSREKMRSKVIENQFISVSEDGCAVEDVGNSVDAVSVSTRDERINGISDKYAVSQDNDEVGSSSSTAGACISPQHNSGVSNGFKDKDNSTPKFKWGDLDEGLLLNYGKASGAECKFGAVKDQSKCLTRSMSESLPCVDPSGPENDNVVEITVCDDKVLTNTSSFSPEPKEVPDAVNSASSEIHSEKIENGTVDSQLATVSGSAFGIIGGSKNGEIQESSFKDISLAQNDNEATNVFTDLLTLQSDCADVPIVPQTDSVSSLGETVPCTTEVTLENCNTKTGGEPSSTPFSGGSSDAKHESSSNNVTVSHSTVNADPDIASEGKERFRERLWCFLFENLNRAIDELYLLCELECDLEQMKEVNIILEEAASDFRELKSRVEKFEKSKGTATVGADLSSLVMQSDHRRPHALSWEVRRMASSPHRAEILSSSLEVFRKIQEARTSERTKNTKGFGSDGYKYNVKGKRLPDMQNSPLKDEIMNDSKKLSGKEKMHTVVSDASQRSSKGKRSIESAKPSSAGSRVPQKERSAIYMNGKSHREMHGLSSEAEEIQNRKNKVLTESFVEKNIKSIDSLKHFPFSEGEGDKKNALSGRSLDAWKEKRNWEDILNSPHRMSASFSYSPCMNRKTVERMRFLHDKLMSPEKKKKSAIDLKKEAEEKHARATRIRTELENERVQKLQRTSEKLNKVNEWQTVRSNKLRESMFARHRLSESRHEAHLAKVVRRAGDESSKVNEVRFITSLNEENKKHILRKKLEDSELRRAEKLQTIKIKQKEDIAREEAVLERRRLIEVEKLQRLAEIQRRKREAQIRREEERKASNAAREAKAMEQLRRKEIRARAQKEEAELLAQKLAERLRESEQRRKFYLEQIRERASMDFRDQTSPLFRRVSVNGQNVGRSISSCNGEETHSNDNVGAAGSCTSATEALKHSLKRRIKKVRQRLMSMKYEFPEPSFGAESSSLGYRTSVGTAKAKICRWLQDLQILRQARKEGVANFGLITAEMIKFLDGKDAELQASRQSGLIDFIASTLPATHSSKPEARQVTVYLLRLLRVVLGTQANKCYFLVQNLLPPIIPMLTSALENYIRVAALLNTNSSTNSPTSKTLNGNFETISEILNGFLWSVAAIIGLESCNECQTQMQDGLVELVIAYQIIHRLRDLFALYDRPQAEVSPFPSVILQGINLLSVLTSKFRGSLSVDWDLLIGDVPGDHLETVKLPLIPESKDTSGLTSVDSLIPPLVTDSLATGFSAIPIDNQTDDTLDTLTTSIPTLTSEKPNDINHAASDIQTVNSPHNSVTCPGQDKLKCSVMLTQKNENGSASICAEQCNPTGGNSDKGANFLLSAMAETGLACLPSMLTAVLLQANNRSAEQSPYVLPSNFEEVSTGVLKVLNNLALLDLNFIQQMLAQPDLKMEFFHLMSFILSHATTNWGVVTDKIGLLLMESLSLLGYFSLFHPENQAVLRWGKSPTILHKVCDLPFGFFTNPELMPVLASTLVAASYGCEQNKALTLQELSMDMLLQSLRSCKSIVSASHGVLIQNSATAANNSIELNQILVDKIGLADSHSKSNRNSSKGTRVAVSGGRTGRRNKQRIFRDGKLGKLGDETVTEMGSSGHENSFFMLHYRFPSSFIDKVEEFFAAEFSK